MKSESTYHYQFGAVVKVTLRDGEVSQEEKTFLDHLAKVLGISGEEYDHIMQNYLTYSLEPTTTYNERLESMYTLTKLISEDETISGEKQTLWLERMAKAIGFTPGNVKYIVGKSLAVIERGIDQETYKEEIRNINK
ncbi:TerB family tellurite resistance protein [uncultured Aquimarina sp.]|uniref:TerB family tellurite resistance protein n=1 Tax=uncultured Aquimarina sp. TaxID=575652 RepID=UPI00261BA0AA|nr:TerB family tellurite resistance protein [uncultured Aquimarina sp.]